MEKTYKINKKAKNNKSLPFYGIKKWQLPVYSVTSTKDESEWLTYAIFLRGFEPTCLWPWFPLHQIGIYQKCDMNRYIDLMIKTHLLHQKTRPKKWSIKSVLSFLGVNKK